MDFITEVVGEIIGIFIEGTGELAKSKKTPRTLRIIIIINIVGIMMFLFYMAYASRADEEFMWGYLFFGGLILFFLLKLFRDYIKRIDSQ